MTNAQKPNKRVKNKSNKRTTRAGSRGHKRPVHGKGKGNAAIDKKKKKRK